MDGSILLVLVILFLAEILIFYFLRKLFSRLYDLPYRRPRNKKPKPTDAPSESPFPAPSASASHRFELPPNIAHLAISTPVVRRDDEHSSDPFAAEMCKPTAKYKEGYDDGFKVGYNAGYDDASKIIEKDAYRSGYQAGLSVCHTRAQQFISEFEDTFAFESVKTYDFSSNPRLYSAAFDSVGYVSPFSLSVKTSSDGENIYNTTLFSCSCPDYQFRKVPCKHMLHLAIDFGLLTTLDVSEQRLALSEMQKQFFKLRKQQEKTTRSIRHLAELQEKLTSVPASSDSTVVIPCKAELQRFTEKKDRKLCRLLSDHEYESMIPAARYQLALKLELDRKKNRPEIGRAFERYIGYCCEQKHYSVIYNGALEKKHDQGRDLLAISPDRKTIYAIQCKYYAADKEVHENAVMQLFGSVSMLSAAYSGVSVFGVLVSSCTLSSSAKDCLRYLDTIRCFENIKVDLRGYPVVKCAVSSSGDKFYYLPFDPCYDSVVADHYVSSVPEAMREGFVRAVRFPKK